jgi:hypothetical protein
MPASCGIRAYATADSRGQRLVLSDEYDRDAMSVSGRWISAVNPVEVRQ